MIQNGEMKKRLKLVEKYSTSVRFLKSYFYAEKKDIIEFYTVCIKMSESLRSLSPHECEQIIRELANDFKNWLFIISLRQLQYVKLEKSVAIEDIYVKISDMITELNC